MPEASTQKPVPPPARPLPIPPVLVFHGPERFEALGLTEKLRKQLTKVHGQLQVVLFDGSTTPPAEILDELRSTGLLASQKLVIVDNADALLKAADDEPAPPTLTRRPPSKSARELFEAYARAPEPTATLVLRANTWKPGKLDKAIVQAGGEITEYKPLTDDAAVVWVLKRARTTHAVPMDDDAAELLIASIGTDLAHLDSEAGKLAIAALARNLPSITRTLVAELTGTAREEELFTLQSVLLQPDPQTSLAYLRDMLQVSRHNPVALGIACLALARQLDGMCRGLAAGENPSALNARLKIWGKMADRLPSIARRLNPASTAELLLQCTETDARNKSGRGDQTHNIEALVLRFNTLMTH